MVRRRVVFGVPMAGTEEEDKDDYLVGTVK
jgi:hypothetical protein